MIDERYSFLSMAELIEAKCARRLSLLAEIDYIDKELVAARTTLSKLRLSRKGDPAETTHLVSGRAVPLPVATPLRPEPWNLKESHSK